MKQWNIVIRSILFNAVFHTTLISYSALCLIVCPWMPLRRRFAFSIQINRFVIWWFRICCGVRYEFHGLEKLPKDSGAVILCNHQSEWETFFLQVAVSPLCTVLKKELLRIPFFGWALALIKPIAIDRSTPKGALKQIVQQGKVKLKNDFSVLIFPEGTRVKPGENRKFAKTGALLAKEARALLVPVAHNAGHCWPPRGFIKYPGVIRLEVGDPIDPADKSIDELAQISSQWIQQRRDGPPG